MIVPRYTVPMGKREDILAATCDLIVEDGIQALSFSRIFARAKVGAGTVYNYFENKEILVNELYRNTLEIMDAALLVNYDKDASIKDRFCLMLLNMVGFVRAHPKENALLTALSHSPYIGAELRDRPRASLSAALDLIDEGQKAGIIVSMDGMVAMSMAAVSIICVVEGQAAGKYPTGDAIIEQAIEACWRMIAVPGNPAL